MMAGIFGRLFGRTETKESATGRIMVLTPGQAVWTDRSYKAFAEEAYQRNNIAYKAINSIADSVASVPWTAWKGKREQSVSPALDLIANPNPMQAGAQYMRAKTGFLMLAGNGYEETVELRGQPAELYQLRPDRMKVIAGSNGFPEAYQYEVGGRKVRFDVDPVTMRGPIRHLRMWHPTNDWLGMSPIEAAAYGVDQHNEAASWIQSLLQKSARPSGALAMKGDATLSDDEFNRLKTQIDEQYSGGKNAGRPMLLEGGMEWQQMGLSPVDMNIIETKLSAARDIALALGVPPMLLGIPGDNTYSNYQEARLSFWEDTVIPLLGMIADDWNASIGEAFGVTLKPDLDQVPAIVEKKRAQWDMLDKTTSLTLNEKREAMGYQPVEGGDVIMVQSSVIPLAMAQEPPAPPPPQLAPPAPEDEDLANATAEDVKALAYGLGGNVTPIKAVK